MLGNGSGIQAWYNSLGLVPNAVAGVNQSLGNAMQNISAQRRQENAEERRRRDIKTAERKQRQAMATNLGIGVGGAALGAGIGTALAAPVGGLSAAGGAGLGGAAGGGASAAAESSIKPSYEMPVSLGSPSQSGTFQQTPMQLPPADANVYRSAIPPDGTSSLGDPYGPPQATPQTFMPTSQPSDQLMMSDLGPGPMYDAPQTPKFGYLGNSRGQVFGNLFLQGLGGVVPGMAGVASGINQANQMNYQMGRDATTDAFRSEQLGLSRDANAAREAYYKQRLAGGGLGTTNTDFIRNYEYLNKIDPALAQAYSGVYSGSAARPAATNPVNDAAKTLNAVKTLENITGAYEDPRSEGLVNQAIGKLGGGMSATEFDAQEQQAIDSVTDPAEKQKLIEMLRRRKMGG